MSYNPDIHHRRSIRLKGYDYSKKGAYFITLNLKNRLCLFGNIVDDEMLLNEAGIMVNKWWEKIPEKFPGIELGVYQIMPNHFHAIVINNGIGNSVGVDPCVNPTNTHDPCVNPTNTHDPCVNPTNTHDPRVNPNNPPTPTVGTNPGVRPDAFPKTIVGVDPRVNPMNEITGQTHRSAPTDNDITQIEGEHMGSPLRDIVQWFKTMSTNEYIRGVKSLNWHPFYGKLWQRNYWEHIIREERSSQAIANYIINNPKNWKQDKNYASFTPPHL
jgi:putative transposase